jgi:MerR family transcriptional regulator, copper efflux regulator
MLLIGQLSEATGLSREALRFYEQRGLLRAARSESGYRRYPAEAVELVGYIQTAQKLGFTLAEIARGLPKAGEQAPSAPTLAAILAEKLADIDDRIEQLQSLRVAIAQRIGLDCPMGPSQGAGEQLQRMTATLR